MNKLTSFGCMNVWSVIVRFDVLSAMSNYVRGHVAFCASLFFVPHVRRKSLLCTAMLAPSPTEAPEWACSNTPPSPCNDSLFHVSADGDRDEPAAAAAPPAKRRRLYRPQLLKTLLNTGKWPEGRNLGHYRRLAAYLLDTTDEDRNEVLHMLVFNIPPLDMALLTEAVQDANTLSHS